MTGETRAYVDGFNLYRSLLQANPPLKWLDLSSLWERIFPDLTVSMTYYFTAKVRQLPLDRGAPARQERYLSALRSLPQLEIVEGHFHVDTTVQRPVSGTIRDRVEVHRTREKGSDVNLASYLLRDCYSGVIERALVVSNDSDLEKPLRFAEASGIEVILLTPTARPSSKLVQTASQHFVLAKARIAEAQFPAVLKLASGRELHRPREWA